MARAEQNPTSRRSFLRGAAAAIPITVVAPLPALADPGDAMLLAMEQKITQAIKQNRDAIRELGKAESAIFAWSKRNPPELSEPWARYVERSVARDPNSNLKAGLHAHRSWLA
jgi:hypothetical protein